uniref:DUF4340 domain-containing protein n=1 Tax=Cyanothece sp. (strain PCC 7425 / ATCC 29141) TaxID=395961 RepID=B8HUA0_CYAP4
MGFAMRVVMRTGLMLLALTGLANITAGELATRAESPSAEVETMQLPAKIATALQEDLAQKTKIPRAQLRIYAATPQTWPNGCLGLARPGEMCTQATVRGWQVEITDGTRLWTYRTNATGSSIRAENLASPKVLLPSAIANQVLADVAARSGQAIADLKITMAEPKVWSDACLGLGGLDLLCAEVLTPGWQIVVQTERQRLVYRSDRAGKVLKLDEAGSQMVGQLIQPPGKIPSDQLPPPAAADVVFREISSGGLRGRTITRTLMQDGRLLESEVSARGGTSSRQLAQANPKQLDQFQWLLKERRFSRFNQVDYPAPAGAADYITTTLSTPDATVRFADIEVFKLSEDLQTILRTWQDLSRSPKP